MKTSNPRHALPVMAQNEVLATVCRSHGLSVTEARIRCDRDNHFADKLAKELNAILDILDKAYAEMSKRTSRLRERATKIIGKNDGASLRRELAAAIKKSNCRLSPMEALRLDAKTPAAFNFAKAYIKPGQRVTDEQALIIYTSTRKTVSDPVCRYEIERGFLTQDGPFIKAARAYCKSIGLNA